MRCVSSCRPWDAALLAAAVTLKGAPKLSTLLHRTHDVGSEAQDHHYDSECGDGHAEGVLNDAQLDPALRSTLARPAVKTMVHRENEHASGR